MQELTPLPNFETVERNLREMFRAVATGKASADVREVAGVSIASSGASFQMFNAAFLNGPVLDQADLERRILLAQTLFRARNMAWSLWVCEELLPQPLRKRLVRVCQRHHLHFATEMPAMVTERIASSDGRATMLEIAAVTAGRQLEDFCAVGAACFRVPPPWFQEIYDSAERLHGPMRAWVGYRQNKPVSTVATIESADAVGIYNLATLSAFRKQGLGEAMLRHALAEVEPAQGAKPAVLQSTTLGMRLYQRLGFRTVGRILVFPSL